MTVIRLTDVIKFTYMIMDVFSAPLDMIRFCGDYTGLCTRCYYRGALISPLLLYKGP